MKKIENECVSCDIPCMGSHCPYRNTVHYYCDDCKEDVETLYHYDGKELCIDCIEKKLEKVE